MRALLKQLHVIKDEKFTVTFDDLADFSCIGFSFVQFTLIFVDQYSLKLHNAWDIL